MLPVSSELKGMQMLDVNSVDLDALVDALEDHSDDASWWLDPTTGAVEFRFDDESFVDDGDDEFVSRNLLLVDPGSSRAAYGDMVDFTALVDDARANDLLTRALQGRGAFRRFKDTLFDYPELRQEWFAFHDRRMRERAIEWLADRDLISREAADGGLAELGAEPERVGPLGATGVAELAATELRDLYGDRLVGVLLYGSQARGDAGPESDIDLVVVLRDIQSPWDELRFMDDLMWQLSSDHGFTVSALPVTDDHLQRADRPVLIEARSHGVRLA